MNGHAVHVLPLLVPVIAFLAVLGPDAVRCAVRRSVPLLVATVASLVAAVVHLAVMPEHVAQSLLLGAFFLVLAVAELAFAVLLWTVRWRSLVQVGVVGNALTVAVWLVSRTTGLPFGPGAGTAERAGAWDLLAVTAEITTMVALHAVLAPRRRLQLVLT